MTRVGRGSWRTIEDGPNQALQSPISQKTGVVALSVVWNPMRSIFVAALRNHGFYSSPDGVTWTRLARTSREARR